MEWLVLLLFAVVAAALIGLPLWLGPLTAAHVPSPGVLREERRRLLADLYELDDDAASGRVSVGERLAGRSALAPRLRAVTEALRDAGDDPHSGA